MAEKQILKGRNDIESIDGFTLCSDEFNVFRKRVEKIKTEMVSTSECFDYILKEINSENENINRLLLWNQKRLNLLNELSEKIKKLNVQYINIYESMYDLINCKFNDINKIETQK